MQSVIAQAMEFSGDVSQHYPPKIGHLPTTQITFEGQSYQKFHRPRPTDMMPEHPTNQRNKHLSLNSETTTSKLNKRTSRFGLAGLFGRSRTNLIENQQEKLDTPWEGNEAGTEALVGDSGVSRDSGRASPSLDISALPAMDGPAAPLKHRASKAALSSKSSFQKVNSFGKSIPWSPPPLFQAYPQAVKHATLRVPTLSAEAIIRLSSDRDASTSQRSDSYTPMPSTARARKEKRSKRTKLSDALAKTHWHDKVFVLITSGYILQYSGEGAFDRAPEKLMPLSKDSAAFASDAIPGKPYVLQISQVSDEEGRVDTEASRSMIKKLGLRIDSKRSTSCFFLVLESPEDISSWLVAARKEIEAMGGKEYKPDEFHRPATRDSASRLQQRPSQRYLVRRDRSRFTKHTRISPSDPSFGDKASSMHNHQPAGDRNCLAETSRDRLPPGLYSDNVNVEEIPMQTTDTNSVVVNRQSLATNASMESRSLSNTTASINQTYLDGLRGSPRQSYASTSAKTAATSRDSSPAPSLAKAHRDSRGWTVPPYEIKPPTSTSIENTCVVSIVRGSSPVGQGITEFRQTPSSSQRVSVHKFQHQRSPSPAAPNFSVPTFSKRYSSTTGSPASSIAKSTALSPQVTLNREPPSPPMIPEEVEMVPESSPLKDVSQELFRSQLPPVISSSETDYLPTPPHSSGFHETPASDADRSYSRRFSSLEYSRGISPLRLAMQAPAPHPPPTIALPALPPQSRPARASLIPPPILKHPFKPNKSSARYSMLPPPPTSPPLPAIRPSSSSAAAGPPSPPHTSALNSSIVQQPSDEHAKVEFVKERKLRRPISMQVCKDLANERPALPAYTTREVSDKTTVIRPIGPPATSTTFKSTFDAEGLTPTAGISAPSPPKPTRQAPPPPSPQGPETLVQKITPKLGREPPPVSSPPKSRISITSPAESYFDNPAPHPFIPPIRFSERLRGSLDGPWNADYGAPQRTFFDLSTA